MKISKVFTDKLQRIYSRRAKYYQQLKENILRENDTKAVFQLDSLKKNDMNDEECICREISIVETANNTIHFVYVSARCSTSLINSQMHEPYIHNTVVLCDNNTGHILRNEDIRKNGMNNIVSYLSSQS